MRTLYTLADSYIGENPDSADTYGRQALLMSIRLRNRTVEAKATYLLGRSFDERGNFDSSLYYFARSNQLYSALEDSTWIVATTTAMGNSYYYMGNHRSAIRYHNEALRLSMKWKMPESEANAHNNLAIVYSEQKFYKEALGHYQAAKAYIQRKGDPYALGAVELNIGNIYAATARPDSAIYYFLKADSLLKISGQQYALALNYSNLGEAYYAKGDLERSEALFNKAIGSQLVLKDDYGLAYSYANLAKVWIQKGDTQRAADLLDSAQSIGDRIGALLILEMVSNGFDLLYRKKGDWKRALEYHERTIRFRDSIQTSETRKTISNLEAEYENEKKENQILSLKAEQLLHAEILHKRNRQLITSVVFGILLLFIILVIGYFVTALRKANSKLADQKNVIELINRNMTDGIRSAERIQKGAFPDPFMNLPLQNGHFLIYRPKDIVSGDFYWSYRINASQAFVGVADCTGHGVSGALLSMVGILSLNRCVEEFGLQTPEAVLQKANELMTSVFNHDMDPENVQTAIQEGMDISLCLIDSRTNILTYAGARGMAAVIRVRQSEVIYLKGDRFGIGDGRVFKTGNFSVQQLQLEPADKVIIYTDGLNDQFGGEMDRKLGQKRVKDLIDQNIQLPIAHLEKDLNRLLDDWKGDGQQTDDITVLGFEL